jgi:hypothetical protein
MPRARKNWIDTEITVDKAVPAVSRGVAYGEGDGTVPLLSLGAMCVKGWKDDRWNPARIPVITHEFKHEPEGLDLRGGAKTGNYQSKGSEWSGLSLTSVGLHSRSHRSPRQHRLESGDLKNR